MEVGQAIGGGALLERDRELDLLAAHLSAAAEGHGRMVLLEGPPGIGKTSLLSAARRSEAGERMRWLAARGAEQERDHAFGVVRQLLEPVLTAGNEPLFAGAAALARTVLAAAEHPVDERPDTGFAGLHGLYWLVHNLAERGPVVLAVDDLQWCDAPSLRFLDYLAVRLEGLRVLGLLTTRAGDATLTIGPIARLAEHPDVHPIPIGPLGEEAVNRWVADVLGEKDATPALAAACRQATGGNPFLLAALLAELRRTPAAARPDAVRRLAPASIVRSVRLRLDALPPVAVRLAQAAALLGDPAEIADAAQLAQLDTAAAAASADALAEAGFLEPGRPLRFVHPVVLAAVRETLPPAERAALHRAAARMSEANGKLDAAAGHLMATDPTADAWAADLLLRAAQVATGRGAADVAVSYLRRAAAEPPGPEAADRVRVELARVAGLAGEPDALVLAERALEAASDGAMRLAAARELALQHALDGRHEAAAAVLGPAVAADTGVPPEQRILAEGMLLLSAGQSGPARRTHRERLRRAADLAAQLGAAAPGPLQVIVGFERVVVEGEVVAGCAMVERGLDGGRLLHELSADSPFPYMAAISLLVGGRYSGAEHLLTEAIADAGRRGSLRGFLVASAIRAMTRLRRGELRAAEADAHAAGEAGEGQSLLSLVYCGAALCGVLIEQGELEEAERAIDSVPAAAHQPATHLGHHVVDMRARLRLAQGRADDALAEFDSCRLYEREMEVRHGCWSAWRTKAAEAHLMQGDHERAASVAAEALALARRLGTPRALGLALRMAGLTSARTGARAALLADAVAVFERGGVAVEHARALSDLGQALAAAERADNARAALEHALERAEAAGAVAVAGEARDRLVALGARPRRRQVTGSGALTPAERRVAELAARGAANRDIAEGLFLTLKTVENHLTSAYRKLGISSRTQLADRL